MTFINLRNFTKNRSANKCDFIKSFPDPFRSIIYFQRGNVNNEVFIKQLLFKVAKEKNRRSTILKVTNNDLSSKSIIDQKRLIGQVKSIHKVSIQDAVNESNLSNEQSEKTNMISPTKDPEHGTISPIKNVSKRVLSPTENASEKFLSENNLDYSKNNERMSANILNKKKEQDKLKYNNDETAALYKEFSENVQSPVIPVPCDKNIFFGENRNHEVDYNKPEATYNTPKKINISTKKNNAYVGSDLNAS